MIYDLVDKNSDFLKQVSIDFDFKDKTLDPVMIAVDLATTMISNGGLGLSANQIGLPHRVFAINAQQIIVCFNPIIVDQSKETVLLEEGCVTYPDLFVKVKRSKKIKVRYTQPNLEVITRTFDGLTARIFQHELDHLNGIAHIDRANSYHLEQAKKNLNKLPKTQKALSIKAQELINQIVV